LDRVSWQDLTRIQNFCDYDRILINLTSLRDFKQSQIVEEADIVKVFDPISWMHIVSSGGIIYVVGDPEFTVRTRNTTEEWGKKASAKLRLPRVPRFLLPLHIKKCFPSLCVFSTFRELMRMIPSGLSLAPLLIALLASAPRLSAAESPGSAPPTLVPAEMFAAPDGLEVAVWATPPLLYNPTNMDIDQDGRIWVAEGVNYRGHSRRRPEGDRIVVLEDTDGDGKADKSTVFVQETNLVAPLGIAVLDNKVIVSQPPDMIVYTDVNRDRKFDPAVDKREVLLTGFNGRNHDHSLHSVTAGPDGLWYWNQGNTGAQFTDRSGKTFRMGSSYVHANGRQVVNPSTIAGQKSDDGHVWIGGFTARMNSDGTGVTIIGHNYRNSYEQTVNSFGDIFQSDNDDPPACRVTPILEYGNAGFSSRDGKRAWRADMRPGQSVPVAEWRQDDPGTMPSGDVYGGGSPTGVAFYENGALGDKWRGLLLACEAGRNVVFGYLPKPDGAGFKLERFDFLTSNREQQWAGSDFLGGGRSVNNELKTLFRPSDVAVGPDGAIYVADWFDGRVGGHSDLDASTSGTIYRVAPKGFKPRIPKFDLATTAGQIEALKSPAANVRNSGFTRLKEQGGKTVPAVAALLKEKNSYLAARAVWLLAQMGPSGVAKVTPLLKSKDDTMRLVAYRALRRVNQDVPALAARMANDSSPAIRREVALTARDLPLAQSRNILVEVAKRFDGRDRSYLEAFGIGCDGKEREMYQAVVGAMGGPAERWSDAFAWLAWRLGSPDAVADFRVRALSPGVSSAQRKLMTDALAFVKSPDAALAMVDLAGTTNFPAQANAMWWLFNRKGNDWADYDLAETMKQRGLYDPDKVQLAAVVMPEPPPGPSKLPPISEILKLKGDVARGKAAVTVCYTCHQIGSQGTDFGPDLTMFGKTQTRETILNSIINPSAEISHGYEGSEVVTKDDLIIHGMVLTSGDPLIIKSMAGQVQTVPRSRVKTLRKFNGSLMFSADMLGLTPQTLADITAYLQSNELK
jgi:putative membrane-bound dehydrogenase-like protein